MDHIPAVSEAAHAVVRDAFWIKFGVFKDVCGLWRYLSTLSRRTCTFWANASLVFCLFRNPTKNLWRESCSHAPASLRRRSSGFGNLLSTLVRFAANGALWRVYFFIHWALLFDWLCAENNCWNRNEEWVKGTKDKPFTPRVLVFFCIPTTIASWEDCRSDPKKGWIDDWVNAT